MIKIFTVKISIIIILFVLLITASGDVCYNDVIKCNYYTNYVTCIVYQNNITTISQAISFCSAGSFTRFNIDIDSELNSTTTNITLNLANNILSLKVFGYVTPQPVYIRSTQTHPSVSTIRLENLVIHNSGIFYTKFPNVTFFYVRYGYFDTDFKFSTLKKLTRLIINNYGQLNSNTKMDKEWVGGLLKLRTLSLYRCGIQNITTDAFENLNSLTALNLGGNNILDLEPEVFRDLTALKQLEIRSNRYDIQIPLDSKNNNAFSPLKHLIYLYLSGTEIIPFDAFSTIDSIERLYLTIASSGIVASTPYQHLRNLTYLSYYGQSNRNTAMDKEWVGGLSTLQYLSLYNCGIQNITIDAFENFTSLTALNLGGNNILELAPEVFRDLTALKELGISYNRHDIKIPLDSKNNNAFSPLKQLTSLYLTYTKIIPFDAFSKIDSIERLYLTIASSGIVASTPFQHFRNLTYISYYSQSNRYTAMDKEWVAGLSTLQYLSLSSCGIQNITTDAFENLTSLTYLDLSRNNILELAPEVFRDLTALKRLQISYNRYDIKIPLDSNNNNAFSPLKQLTYIYLTYTKIIPFEAFSTIGSIKRLYLPIISSGITHSTPFQHLHSLTFLSFFKISLICNCNMQWVSIMGKFGIVIDLWGGWCRNGGHVKDSSKYTGCELTESYQCFNKTVDCKNTCINTPDSYKCACDAGYGLSLIEAESACHDIDECLLNTSQCEQKCQNTLGSYQCYCDLGYSLSDDLISCTDIDECSKFSWNKCEQHQCLNEAGSYRCTCNPGYQLAGDGYSCHDLDECSNASLNTCNLHTCVNELGTYTCICRQGYKLTTNDKTCKDVDECSLVEINTCRNHQCMNEQGSYRCICKDGFELAISNISCHDIDECMDANNSCNPHECLNLVGSYTCSCGDGYQLTTNGKNCEDINECSFVKTNTCRKHQCMNEQGSYRCICKDGFELAISNISCHDIDECIEVNNSCIPHKCLNLVGSYTCLCPGQYKLAANEYDKLIQPSNVSFCLPISSEASNGTYGTLGATVFLVIIIILITVLILLLLISLYMCYNKRTTKRKFQELPNTNQHEVVELPDTNQHEVVELLSNNQTDLSSPEENSVPYYSEIAPGTTYYYTPRININVSNLENIEDLM